MTLVDYQIAELVDQVDLIDSYDSRCLTNIGYDLRAKMFYINSEGRKSITLMPNDSVFVESVEVVSMPKDLLGRIGLKNSRIRQGLRLDAPVYQPGHKTRIYFRLTNVSADAVTLYQDEKYATIFFERLADVPHTPYAGTFQDEFNYQGLADYQDVYRRQVREIEKKAEDLKSMESNIYTNVLSILAIFMALFSFLTVNVTLAANSATIENYLIFNALMLGGISFLVALLNTVIKPKKNGWASWIPAAVCFAIALLLYLN